MSVQHVTYIHGGDGHAGKYRSSILVAPFSGLGPSTSQSLRTRRTVMPPSTSCPAARSPRPAPLAPALSSRTLTKTGPGTLTINGPQSYAANAAVNINGGTINYNTDAGAGGANLAVNVNGGTANFGVAQSLRQIDIAGGSVVNVNTTNVSTTASSLDGSPQNYGLTYGSLASSAAIKSDVYFGGTGIVTIGLAGDYNISGEVDAADYVTWRTNSAGFGGSAGYNLWRQNFGNVFVPGLVLVLVGIRPFPSRARCCWRWLEFCWRASVDARR